MKNNRCIASIIVPTTKDRGPVLPYSVGSILRQTIKEIEVLIIGDGVDSSTRTVIEELMKQDQRIRFFDYPKGSRRGEIYRHEVLTTQAQGEIICYLLDRDLMLPDHVEKMIFNLNDHNFCVQASIGIREDHSIYMLRKYKIGDHIERHKTGPVRNGSFYFSQVGHTLELYKNLPFGWQTTPLKYKTDAYMWRQIVAYHDTSIKSTTDLTILYFKRGNFPGQSAEKRAIELKLFYDKLEDEHWVREVKDKVLFELVADYEFAMNQILLIKGRTWKELPKTILNKWVLDHFVKRW